MKTTHNCNNKKTGTLTEGLSRGDARSSQEASGDEDVA
jgi:hypothetical protein